MEGRPVVLYRGPVPTTLTQLFENNNSRIVYVITGVNIGNSTSGNISVHIEVNDTVFTDGMTISSKDIKTWAPNTVLELDDHLDMYASASGLNVTIDGLAYWT
jgi:hypothetical protein